MNRRPAARRANLRTHAGPPPRPPRRAQPRPASRHERALATRRRILEAAYGLFRARGYAGTTMAAIAAEARVAVQTLYFTFHTKAAIIDEVVGAAVSGFDRWVPPTGPVRAADRRQLREFHPWFRAFEAEPDARRALELFIDAGTGIMERVAPMVSVMREASSDPEARAVSDVGEQRRVDSYGAIVRLLAKKQGGLRRGLTPRRATDLLLTLYSGETWHLLRTRGWSTRELRDWMVEVLAQQLLLPPR